MKESRGVIMFNVNFKCTIRAIVALRSLRKYWNGPVTFFLEQPSAPNLDKVCEFFNVNVVNVEDKNNFEALVKKTSMFGNPPYDRTLWIDSDTIICGKIDEMFDNLDDADCCIPNFCDWVSSGRAISRRIQRFKGLIDDKYIEKALIPFPAINTGVFSFKKSDKWKRFMKDWIELADKGSKAGIFIPDEVAFQILLPSISEWGLTYIIADKKFNVSVRFGEHIEDKRIIHMHGQKHLWNNSLGDLWKKTFEEMRVGNIANINSFIEYADKRLKKYLLEKTAFWTIIKQEITHFHKDIEGTQTQIDEHFFPSLELTYPNWKKDI